MRNLTTYTNLLGDIDPFSILTDNSLKYPPYNIVKRGEETHLEIALAGYSKDSIDVSENRGVLTIEVDEVDGDKDTSDQEEYIHRGVSKSSVRQSWKLGEYVIVDSVTFTDGVLKVVLVQDIPEEAKPKSHKIK